MSTTEACQIGGCLEPSSGDGRNRDRDRARLLNYLLEKPEGVALPVLVGEIFDNKGTIEPDADYNLTRRYVEDAEYLETTRRDGFVWVYVSDRDCALETQLAHRKTLVGRGGDGNDGQNYAKDRVRDYFETTTGVYSDTVRAWLKEELSTYARSISDTYHVLRHRDRDEYLTLPNRTRYTDEGRALSVLMGFEDALSRASRRHDAGTLLTLTPDPKRFSSHADAVDAFRR